MRHEISSSTRLKRRGSFLFAQILECASLSSRGIDLGVAGSAEGPSGGDPRIWGSVMAVGSPKFVIIGADAVTVVAGMSAY